MKRAGSGSWAASPASIALVDAVHIINQTNVDGHMRDYRLAATLISRSEQTVDLYQRNQALLHVYTNIIICRTAA